ncbi:ABC transporter ATP-binding protein [Aurantimonas sp. VKM B-3413]|uniref:ABC transporter ATP-binding protein n=1 Tax=Aurantimonas sp. VKM B-3413 TaxID=2779401 RepID=UPI001E2D4821|nr:ABC transporter ATP-binding protein [Aurantimonas sp. VKM B-3413]MCB8839788.1 ABC transporter ATP-binding protein [Aurantimonas sp. VKM B-3413]
MSAVRKLEPADSVLAVEGLTSGYDAAPVVRNVSFSIAAGEILVILGKNGMGKSTLLKTIMGFVRASSGKVRLAGADITNSAPHLIARRAVAYTPQEYAIFQDLTVEENLRLGVESDELLRQRLDDVEAAFPRIAQRLRQRAGTLSGGEQKMLLLSRGLIARPKIMLIDEISEGLQPTMVAKMAEVLQATKDKSGVAILLVEQNLPFALSVADRYAILKIGEIVERGDVAHADTAATLEEHLRI